jgi:DNA-binding CsgD family transcriptional regulator
MSLHLNATARRHITAAQQAMLTPLAHEDLDTWMLSVNDALRAVVGADHVIAFATEPTSLAIFSNDTELQALSPLQDALSGYDEAGFAMLKDPHIAKAHRIRRRGGTGAYHERQLGDPRAMKQTDFFQATFEPAGARYMIGLSTPLPHGEVTICTAFERPDAEGFSTESLQKLQMLAPAFEAGVRMWQRLAGCRDLLDKVDAPVAVFGPDGHELFHSRALQALLAADPESNAVVCEMRRLERTLRTFHEKPLYENGTALNGKVAGQFEMGKFTELGQAAHEVRTKTSLYRIYGSLLQPLLCGVEAAIVTVERRGVALPSRRRLQTSFGLTPREADVTLLLAEGLGNNALAERLYISPHTARRHTEKVLDKLGIASRAAVAITILRSL